MSEAQRCLDQFGLHDLTAKGIKTAHDFPDMQKKLKCIGGCIRNCMAATEGSFQEALDSFDTLSFARNCAPAWLGQLLDLRVVNTVKLCQAGAASIGISSNKEGRKRASNLALALLIWVVAWIPG